MMTKHLWAVILTLLSMLLFSGNSSAKIVCGGEGQEACESAPAIFVKRVHGLDACRNGGFVDPINGGECWKCPEGMVRSWKPITDKASACIKPLKGLDFGYKPATQIKTNGLKCPNGQFFDPQNGGECWSCPEGFDRTTNKVAEFNACQKHEVFKQAKKMGSLKLTCGKGQFADPNGGCYSCPTGYNRTANSVTSTKACSSLITSDKPAIYKRKAYGILGTKCNEGEIYDPNGSCYVCPENHSRTAKSITSPKACHASYTDLKSAKSHGSLVLSCRSGQFLDPNGGCYTCPSNYNRTAHPVTDKRACSMLAPQEFSRAQLESQSCDASKGQFVDLVTRQCWSCPESYERGIASVSSDKACVTRAAQTAAAEFLEPWGCDPSKKEFWDPMKVKDSKLGSCWKCPDQYSRGIKPVNHKKACVSNEARWENDPYIEPSLFGLGGKQFPYIALANDWFNNPEKIAAITSGFYAIANELGKTGKVADNYVIEQWAILARNPNESDGFKALVFAHVQSLLHVPSTQRSEHENQLVDAFSDYIKQRKIFLAQQALSAYDAWEKIAKVNKTESNSTNLVSMYGDDITPPNFQEITEKSLHGSKVAGGPALIAIGAFNAAMLSLPTQTLADIGTQIFPYAMVKLTKQTLGHAAEQGLSNLATRAAVAGAKFTSVIGRSIGPQIAFAIAQIVSEARLDQVNEIINARPKLVEALSYNKRTQVDLANMLTTEEGQSKMVKFWSLATDSNKTTPRSLVTVVAKAAKAAKQSGYSINANDITLEGESGNKIINIDMGSTSVGTETETIVHDVKIETIPSVSWQKIGDNIQDVFVGPSDSVYALAKVDGTSVIQGYDNDRKQWQQLAKDAVAMAATPDNVLWVIGSEGALTTRTKDGGNVQDVNRKASDITISTDGDVWIISDVIGSQGGEVFLKSGQKWQQKQGIKAVSIAIADGYLWAITKKGDIYRSNSNEKKKLIRAKMTKMPGKAFDIAHGADNSVWMIGTDNKIYKWNQSTNNWQSMMGSANKIAVGTANNVWTVNKANQLYSGKYSN